MTARSRRCHRSAPALAIAALAATSGCATSWMEMTERPVAVVLSAGGPAGLAHLGALAAIRDEGLRIDSITGTSMGALVGALHATAPGEVPAARYAALMQSYAAETTEEATANTIKGGILGGLLLALVSGGAAVPIVVGAGVGAAIGRQQTDAVSLPRLTVVLDGYFRGARIESLPVPFATFYKEKADASFVTVDARSGSLAEAVSKSIANPVVFRRFDPVASGYVDAGIDASVETPVEDTCRLFPRARLLVVNVTGRPVMHTAAMKCPLLEIAVGGEVAPEAMAGGGPAFERAVASGYATTRKALRAAR